MKKHIKHLLIKFGNRRLFRCLNRLIKFNKYYSSYGQNWEQKIDMDKWLKIISFYDLIRIHDITVDELKYMREEIPFEYVLQYLNNKDYTFIYCASWINIELFMMYPKIRDIITNKFIRSLSSNKYLPISYVWANANLYWDYDAIAWYNLTLRESDLDTGKFYVYSLSSNKAVLLEWILARPSVQWNWEAISRRLTFNEIQRLHKVDSTKLNWYSININEHITPDIILSHGEYPWQYVCYYRPDLNYASIYTDMNKDYVLKSDNISLDDLQYLNSLNYFGIYSDFISFVHDNWIHIKENANVTCDDLIKMNINETFNDVTWLFSKNQPKLKNMYKKIYQQIIKEINYI